MVVVSRRLNLTTPAIFHSPTKIECDTPASAAGPAKLYVSTNSQESGVTVNFVDFTFLDVVSLSSVTPVVGRSGGGTAVVVRGTGFSAASAYTPMVVCRFGSATVRAATVFNSTAVACISPPSSVASGFNDGSSGFNNGGFAISLDVLTNAGHTFS